jgi:hypothetical protein
VVCQFRPSRAEGLVIFLDTTDFSRVVFQLQPRALGLVIFLDTIDFSRVVFQFRPSVTVQSLGGN